MEEITDHVWFLLWAIQYKVCNKHMEKKIVYSFSQHSNMINELISVFDEIARFFLIKIFKVKFLQIVYWLDIFYGHNQVI